jgi:hypothetical protein
VQSSDTGGGTPAAGNPLGVPKASYIAGLYALGTEKGVFESAPENITAWNARIAGAGDPYLDGDPVLQQAARGLTELRSAYYQDEGWESQVGGREVAVYSIQGWTDDPFGPVESFRMFKYLKRLDRTDRGPAAGGYTGYSEPLPDHTTYVGLGEVRLPPYGNHWPLAPGHRVRLDLTQVDEPTFRPNNLPSSIAYGPPELVLPTREAQDATLTGAP